MKHSRKITLAGAVLAWAGVLTMVITAWAGTPGDGDESRLFGFFLAAAITLSLAAVFTAQAADPRTAYRLGWDARGRHENRVCAPVAELGEQRHA